MKIASALGAFENRLYEVGNLLSQAGGSLVQKAYGQDTYECTTKQHAESVVRLADDFLLDKAEQARLQDSGVNVTSHIEYWKDMKRQALDCISNLPSSSSDKAPGYTNKTIGGVSQNITDIVHNSTNGVIQNSGPVAGDPMGMYIALAAVGIGAAIGGIYAFSKRKK